MTSSSPSKCYDQKSICLDQSNCRSSQTSWPRTTAQLVFRSRRLGPTNQLNIEADGKETMEIIHIFNSLFMALSSSAQDCESEIIPGHSKKLPSILYFMPKIGSLYVVEVNRLVAAMRIMN